jgi:CRP-like cAMP-binding protein
MTGTKAMAPQVKRRSHGDSSTCTSPSNTPAATAYSNAHVIFHPVPARQRKARVRQKDQPHENCDSFPRLQERAANDLSYVRNGFLAALPSDEFDLLRPLLTLVELKRRAVIHDENKIVDAVYFIETGIVSRVVRSPIDGSVEVAMVGSSGFVGLGVILGTMAALHRTTVLISGTALRISATALKGIMETNPSIREHFLRYVQILMAQKAHVSFCNAKHPLRARLARWLLSACQGIDGSELAITHSLIGRTLGVRREGVSHVMKDLETTGAVKGHRGVITIVDSDALKSCSCPCYRSTGENFLWNKTVPRYQHRLDPD